MSATETAAQSRVRGEDALQPVRELALSLDVRLDVIAGERAFVRDIANHGERGSGSRVLAALCARCDALGLRIALNAKDGEPFLIALYEGLGFEVVDEDDDEGPLMVRKPRPGDGQANHCHRAGTGAMP